MKRQLYRFVVCIDIPEAKTLKDAYIRLRSIMEAHPMQGPDYMGWETSDEAYVDGEQILTFDLDLAICTALDEMDPTK
jgi:hypothetical protein